ncbi:MAG: CPBP family intramembrane metalloprotease [Roseivirga sp.]|nr:CPBP family intramembrane metalloprotease [Roseivirga sp.]
MKLKLLNPQHYYSEFRQLTKFVITPVYDSNRELSISQKISGTWTLFVVKTVLTVLIGIVMGLVYDPVNQTTNSMAERFNPAALLMVGVFILPLLEEVAFRLSLKFKPVYLALTLGVLGYYISSKAIYQAKLSDVHHHFENRMIIVLAIMFIAYPLFSLPKVKKVLDQFWKNNFKWILYVSSFGFAWVHIFNYELSLEHLLLMPVITLPKLVGALSYGYARVNYGFVYSFAIHICNNSIGFMVSTLFGSD